MKYFFNLLTIMGVSLFWTACATYRVTITSEPSGAVVIAGRQKAITPCTLDVPLSVRTIEVSMPNYETQTFDLPEVPASRRYLRSTAPILLRPVAFVCIYAGSFVGEWRIIIPGIGLFGLAEHVRAEYVVFHVDFMNEENSEHSYHQTMGELPAW
ncbi:MAG: PEGA domain-containing protein [Verrucomicrobia bacterium]|nr:PEGA domain-containing protein [Verrucomicrobiota bacterium]MCH8512995.1 PEGA domain-containing protein [Kiritimatiellia bacterium]